MGAVGLPQVGNARLRRRKGAAHVDVEDEVEPSDRGAVDLAEEDSAGIVDENVDAPELAGGLRSRLLNVWGVKTAPCS